MAPTVSHDLTATFSMGFQWNFTISNPNFLRTFSTQAHGFAKMCRHATIGMLQIIGSFADVESECWRVSIITTQGTKHSKNRRLRKAGKQTHT